MIIDCIVIVVVAVCMVVGMRTMIHLRSHLLFTSNGIHRLPSINDVSIQGDDILKGQYLPPHVGRVHHLTIDADPTRCDERIGLPTRVCRLEDFVETYS